MKNGKALGRILLFILTLIYLSDCTVGNKKNNSKGKSEVSEVNPPLSVLNIDSTFHDERLEIYCWCFISEPSISIDSGIIKVRTKGCNSTLPIMAIDLIRKEYLLDTISDKYTIERVKKILFESSQPKKLVSNIVDARFLLLMRKTGEIADSAVLYAGDKFILNSSLIYDYSFNVMDSIRSILKRDSIICP